MYSLIRSGKKVDCRSAIHLPISSCAPSKSACILIYLIALHALCIPSIGLSHLNVRSKDIFVTSERLILPTLRIELALYITTMATIPIAILVAAITIMATAINTCPREQTASRSLVGMIPNISNGRRHIFVLFFLTPLRPM